MRTISYGISLVFHTAVLGGLYWASTLMPTYTIQEGQATIELMASAASRADPKQEEPKPIKVLMHEPITSESTPADFELAQSVALPMLKDALRRIEPEMERPIPTTNVKPERPSEELAFDTEAMELTRKPRETEKELASVDAEASPASQANEGGEADELPKPLSNRKIPYPAEAAQSKISGSVLLAVFVATNGTATRVTIEKSSGYEVLDNAAVNMVRQWRFSPARRNGSAVPYEVYLPVNFSIPGE